MPEILPVFKFGGLAANQVYKNLAKFKVPHQSLGKVNENITRVTIRTMVIPSFRVSSDPDWDRRLV